MTDIRATATRRSGHAQATGRVSSDDTQVTKEFRQVVNMSSEALTAWLRTDESRTVGDKSSDKSESIGHRSGRRIVRLLDKNEGDLTAGDHAHMRKVVGYVHRHMAQRPAGNVTGTNWRFSLMNWGHDPSRLSSKSD